MYRLIHQKLFAYLNQKLFLNHQIRNLHFSQIKDLLYGQNVDFVFDDMKIIFNLNTQIITDGLVDTINISNFKNRLKILKYLNE